MLKFKSSLSIILLTSLLASPVQAGITTSLLLTPYVMAQSVIQQVSATVSGAIVALQKGEIGNYGQPGAIRKEVITSDNSPILTGEDVALYTDQTFTQPFLTELKQKKLDVLKLHKIVKNTYLVDYGAQNSLNQKDQIDLGGDSVITIDPMEDAKTVNTQEFIQHKRYLSLHHGLAVAEKILALMPQQEKEVLNMSSNIKSRRDVQSLENGLSWLDTKIGIILNELLVVEASILEINSTLLMQDRKKQIVED